jgi:thiamine-phosphate pyrophosphorylase
VPESSGRPVLCLVTDRRLSRWPLDDAVAASVAAGVNWVQVREKDLEGAALLDLTRAVIAAARRGAGADGRSVKVIVNRRMDVALAAGADGVHLGFDAVDGRTARALLGPAAWIGVSAHAVAELSSAAAEAASYAQLAPVFAPLSKPGGRAPLGAGALRGVRPPLPVLAQGGVDASNAGELVRCGFAGVAVTGAILLAADPGQAARALRHALDAGSPRGIESPMSGAT